MKRTTSTWALLGSILLTAACSGGNPEVNAGANETANASETTQHEATIERLIERSKERAAVMCAGEWIDVYDFIHPSTKEWMTIYNFLEGKDNHAYAEPTEPQLVAREGDKAYLSMTVLWTPKHPALGEVDNVDPDHDWTERVEWIESWEFIEGDWHMQWPQQYPSEFFEEHADLLKKSEPADKDGDEEVARAEQR